MITSIKNGIVVGLIAQSISLGAGIDNWNTAKIIWRIVWIAVCYAIYLVLERKEDKCGQALYEVEKLKKGD